MRRLLVALLLAGCGGSATSAEPKPEPKPEPPVVAPEPWSDAWIVAEGQRYLDDAEFRRAALEASLTNPENVYSATRWSAYGLQERGWDVLPEWSPRIAAVDDAMVQQLRDGQPLRLPATAARLRGRPRPASFEAWAALGRQVFYGYPLRPEPQAAHALADPQLAARVGLQRGPDGTWPGVVAFEDIDGETKIGITCALCHVSFEGGTVVEGRARRDLDYGHMRLAWSRAGGATLPEGLAERMARWGPGRADITADDDEDPVAIVDLWELRRLRHFTQAATLTHEHPAALAIRQETQILHANRERTRPPRELAWALAVYLYSLRPPNGEAAPTPASERGAVLFEAQCERCHSDTTGAGAPVTAARVGTDAALAHGTARGTGLYRPSPLVRVAAAAPYLHDGSVDSLEALFGRPRFSDDYEGPRGVGAVRGHAFGVDLEPDDRADLLAYLRTR